MGLAMGFFQGASVLLVIGIILAMVILWFLWILLPFWIVGIKRRQDIQIKLMQAQLHALESMEVMNREVYLMQVERFRDGK